MKRVLFCAVALVAGAFNYFSAKGWITAASTELSVDNIETLGQVEWDSWGWIWIQQSTYERGGEIYFNWKCCTRPMDYLRECIPGRRLELVTDKSGNYVSDCEYY